VPSTPRVIEERFVPVLAPTLIFSTFDTNFLETGSMTPIAIPNVPAAPPDGQPVAAAIAADVAPDVISAVSVVSTAPPAKSLRAS
jgi:hypothetical protein